MSEQTTTDDELLTITEVAGIPPSTAATLRYWRHLGTGPARLKIGPGVGYLRSEITRWFHEQASSTGTAHRS